MLPREVQPKNKQRYLLRNLNALNESGKPLPVLALTRCKTKEKKKKKKTVRVVSGSVRKISRYTPGSSRVGDQEVLENFTGLWVGSQGLAQSSRVGSGQHATGKARHFLFLSLRFHH